MNPQKVLALKVASLGVRGTAREMGVSPGTISNAMSGSRKMGPSLLKKLGFRAVVRTVVDYEPLSGGRGSRGTLERKRTVT